MTVDGELVARGVMQVDTLYCKHIKHCIMNTHQTSHTVYNSNIAYFCFVDAIGENLSVLESYGETDSECNRLQSGHGVWYKIVSVQYEYALVRVRETLCSVQISSFQCEFCICFAGFCLACYGENYILSQFVVRRLWTHALHCIALHCIALQ